MSQFQNYRKVLSIGHFEFGVILIEDEDYPIKILITDHKEFMLRILGLSKTIEDAYEFLEANIRNGFYKDGLKFTGIEECIPIK